MGSRRYGKAELPRQAPERDAHELDREPAAGLATSRARAVARAAAAAARALARRAAADERVAASGLDARVEALCSSRRHAHA